MTRLAHAALCGSLLVSSGLTLAARQNTRPITPPAVIESMYGPDLYRHYCATCHGADAKGNGPVSVALKTTPPDLTILARNRRRVFPESEVARVIEGGKAVAAHGSIEMPVWGPIFRSLDPSDTRVKVRIAALVSYIASIQQK
jgi:mono/diheme cytochrome c family protein